MKEMEPDDARHRAACRALRACEPRGVRLEFRTVDFTEGHTHGEQYHAARTAVFRAITQRVLVIPYGRVVPECRQEITTVSCEIAQKSAVPSTSQRKPEITHSNHAASTLRRARKARFPNTALDKARLGVVGHT